MSNARYHPSGERCGTNNSCDRLHTYKAPVPVYPVGSKPHAMEFPPNAIFYGRQAGEVYTFPDPQAAPRAEVIMAQLSPTFPVNDESPRASALNEARDLITGDRNNQYGPPTQDFARTADLLNALGYQRLDAAGNPEPILSSDVAIIIAQVKVSRLMHSRGKRDSWVDLAGYAACGFECATEEGNSDDAA